MNYPGHVLVGVIAGALLALVVAADPFMFFTIVFISAFAALVPDIDHENSKMRKFMDLGVPIFGFFFSFSSMCTGVSCGVENWHVLLVNTLAITGLYMILITYTKPKHRGVTHTLAFAVLFGIALWLFAEPVFALAGFVGYASHLVADKHIKLV